MGMAAILLNDAESFKQINNTWYPFDRRPNVKSGENWSSFSEKKFKDYEIFIHVAQQQGQITPGTKFWL